MGLEKAASTIFVNTPINPSMHITRISLCSNKASYLFLVLVAAAALLPMRNFTKSSLGFGPMIRTLLVHVSGSVPLNTAKCVSCTPDAILIACQILQWWMCHNFDEKYWERWSWLRYWAFIMRKPFRDVLHDINIYSSFPKTSADNAFKIYCKFRCERNL